MGVKCNANLQVRFRTNRAWPGESMCCMRNRKLGSIQAFGQRNWGLEYLGRVSADFFHTHGRSRVGQDVTTRARYSAWQNPTHAPDPFRAEFEIRRYIYRVIKDQLLNTFGEISRAYCILTLGPQTILDICNIEFPWCLGTYCFRSNFLYREYLWGFFRYLQFSFFLFFFFSFSHSLFSRKLRMFTRNHYWEDASIG